MMCWRRRRRSEEHTSELQSLTNLVCRLLLDPAAPQTSTLSLHDALPILTAELFRHSTTAGVRRWIAERATLPRHQLTVRLDGVAVRVKVLDGGNIRVKPEYDDVLAAAKEIGRAHV